MAKKRTTKKRTPKAAKAKAKTEVRSQSGSTKSKAINAGKLPVPEGLSIAETWVHIFSKNEKAKLTDVQISALIKKAFPDREPRSFTRPQQPRNNYNGGKLRCQEAAPKREAHAFNKKGEKVKVLGRVGEDTYKEIPLSEVGKPKGKPEAKAAGGKRGGKTKASGRRKTSTSGGSAKGSSKTSKAKAQDKPSASGKSSGKPKSKPSPKKRGSAKPKPKVKKPADVDPAGPEEVPFSV